SLSDSAGDLMPSFPLGSRPSCVIVQIPQPDPHVVVERVRHTNCQAEAKQSLCQSERIEIAITPEQHAGDHAPRKGGCCEYGIRQVRRSEENGNDEYGLRFVPKNPCHPGQEVILQQKLLVDGPQEISSNVPEIGVGQGM